MIMIKASELVFNSLRLWVILGSCALSRLLLTNAYHPGKDQFNFYVQFPCLNLVEISIFSLQFKCCFFFFLEEWWMWKTTWMWMLLQKLYFLIQVKSKYCLLLQGKKYIQFFFFFNISVMRIFLKLLAELSFQKDFLTSGTIFNEIKLLV